MVFFRFMHAQLKFPRQCLDARCNSALRVSCGLERLSDGSDWRCYLYPFTPLAPVGSLPAAHAWPGHGRRPGQPIRGGPEPLIQTVRPTGAPARASPGATGPRSRPQCRLRPIVTVLSCLRYATLSPLARSRGRLAHSTGSGQLCRSVHAHSL